MRRIRRIVPVLTLAALMVMGTCLSVSAESYKYDGTCVFRNGKMVESFDSRTIASSVSDLQPGDEVTFTVEYKSEYNGSTDWYMENEIIRTLEKANSAKKVSGTGAAENGGYTYELIQYDRNNEKHVLFSNDKVGGDKGGEIIANEEGLEPATNALDDWFYIDTLTKGQSGRVVLNVAFDGETEVNDYMDTDGELQIRFAVELPESGRKAVKTGDQSGLLMWAALGVTAGLLMLVLAFLSSRRDGKREGRKGGRA